MTDEQLLDDLCQAWRSAWVQIAKAERHQDRWYWQGVVEGLACAIAVASGIPDRIQFAETVRAGTDIARLRRVNP
jgi:hypothetical protein